MSTCKCVRVAEAMRLTLAGHGLPHCEQHDGPAQPEGTPLALNDDDGLTAAISAALGVPVNNTINL